MRNGGYLGVRREPNALSAPGVWGVQDAYTADRDGVWPRWPNDVGLKFDPGLLFWLEADYGLYSDVDATVPATADGAQVRSWVNRGTAGLVRFEPANNPMLLRPNNGSPYVELNSALAQPNLVNVKSNNYLWIKSRDLTSTTFRFLASVDPVTGTEGTRLLQGSGLLSRWPSSQTGSTDTTTATNYAESGALFMSWFAIEKMFLYNRMSSAVAVQGGGVSVVTSPSNTPPAAGINIPQGIRAFNTSTLLANGRVKALVWYSTDTPLTDAEANAISAYLGNKWGFGLITGSFG